MIKAAVIVVWAVINAAILFAEQLAELLAPFLLLAGAIWWVWRHVKHSRPDHAAARGAANTESD